MRRTLVACCLLGLGLGAFCAAPSAQAAAPGKTKDGKPPVYKHGKTKYDFAEPNAKEKLMEVLVEGKVDHLHKHDEHEGSFLSQLADQAIWTILVFGVLLFLLWKFAWGPMMQGLVQREHSIEQAFAEARQARGETEKLKAELASEKAKAHEEVRRLIEEARVKAEQLQADIQARGKAEVQTERARLRHEMEREHEQALQDIWVQATNLATLISGKALGRTVSEEDHRRLLDESLAEFRQAGVERKHDIESAHA